MPTYELLLPHKHCGTDYAKGDRVTVRKSLADRLPEVFGKPIAELPAEKAGAKGKE